MGVSKWPLNRCSILFNSFAKTHGEEHYSKRKYFYNPVLPKMWTFILCVCERSHKQFSMRANSSGWYSLTRTQSSSAGGNRNTVGTLNSNLNELEWDVDQCVQRNNRYDFGNRMSRFILMKSWVGLSLSWAFWVHVGGRWQS